MGQDVQAVQEAEAVVVIDEDESAMTLEEAGVENETATGIDDDAQTFEREAVNSGRGSEERPRGLKKVVVGEVGEGAVTGSTQTKSVEACSCYPMVRTQEGATLKGMVGEGH